MSRAAVRAQCALKVIQYALLMEYPAENDILKLRASKKAVKQMGYVSIYHCPCFARHDKWVHIPAPISIKEYVSREYFLQFAAGGGFTDTHGAVYDYKVLHKVDYLMGNYA
jgi:hypothetical protein